MTTKSLRSVLTIDTQALGENWRRLQAKAPGLPCAAVVKADGYGLGLAPVGRALWQAGTRAFYVAHFEEALCLRAALPEADITVLNGLVAEPGAFLEARLRPVLNSLEQLDRWRDQGQGAPANLHVDTGMARLGLDDQEQARLLDDPARLQGLNIAYLMSHLASSEETHNPSNVAQLARLKPLVTKLGLPVSFANSSGVFLGPNYHFDQLRPGVALYGANPTPGQTNPMRPVVRLDCPILQIRELPAGRGVGYNATWSSMRPSRIATIPLGYADGFSRQHSNVAALFWGEQPVPLVGRVSMDLVTVDLSDLCQRSGPLPQVGDTLELLGPQQSVDLLAQSAHTIGYEILTSLGARYERRYL
jgi:alanine racemase